MKLNNSVLTMVVAICYSFFRGNDEVRRRIEIPQYNVIAGPARSVLIYSANTFVKNGKVIIDNSNSALAYISLLVDFPISLKA